MKKKLIIIALATLCLTGCGNAPELKNGEKAIVEFGDGEKISVDEVWKELKESYGLNVLINKIDMKILKDEYKDKQKDMEDYVKYMETSLRANYEDEETLLNTLSTYGYSSIDAYLDTQRLNYLKDLAYKDYAKTQVTDKEVKNYYEKEVVGDINVIHILVKPASDSAKDKAEAETKAKNIIAAIKADVKKGTKLKDAFAKYKDDKSVTYQELGYMNKGEMVEAFEKAAYALKNNSYSTKPVETSYGYHVILRLDQKAKASLKDSEKGIKDTLADKLVEEDSKISVKAMMELRKAHGVKIYDDDLENSYKRNINYQLNQKDSQN